MNNKQQENDMALDLGLGDLLSDSKSTPAPIEAKTTLDIDSLIQSCIEARGSESSSESELAPQPGSSWKRLWQTDEFSRIAQNAEAILQNNPEDIEARLWWVRSHRALRSMPVSMIAAPAEELFRRMENETVPALDRQLASETLAELSTSCWDSELQKKAIRFLGLACSLDSSHRKALQKMISSELQRIRIADLPIADRSEAEQYVSHLRELEEKFGLSALGDAEAPAGTTSGAPSESTRARKKRAVPSVLFLPAKALVFPVVLFGLVVVGGYFGYTSGFSGGTHLPPSVSSPVQVPVSQVIPMPERKSERQGPTLWRILQRLENNESAELTSRSSSENINTTAGLVNTDLPVEPPELALLINAWDQRELVTDTAAARQLDIADDEDSRSETRGDYIVNGYPNLPGTAPSGKGYQTSASGEQMYLIESATYVYQHPSADAPSLAQLEIGNHVEVTEQLGDWLKIVSAQNRTGYIQASAARPLSR